MIVIHETDFKQTFSLTHNEHRKLSLEGLFIYPVTHQYDLIIRWSSHLLFGEIHGGTYFDFFVWSLP